MKKLIYIIFIILFMLLIISCEISKPQNCPKPAFKEGQMVTSVVGNYTGQVVRVHTYSSDCTIYYDVKFNIKSSKTNTHLVGSDDDITTGISEMTYMKEFELKKAE